MAAMQSGSTRETPWARCSTDPLLPGCKDIADNLPLGRCTFTYGANVATSIPYPERRRVYTVQFGLCCDELSILVP